VKQLTARRALPVMARPCQEAQHSGRLLHGPPEGSYPDAPIRRCSPCKGLAIPCGLRLVLEHQGSSEPYNTRVTLHIVRFLHSNYFTFNSGSLAIAWLNACSFSAHKLINQFLRYPLATLSLRKSRPRILSSMGLN